MGVREIATLQAQQRREEWALRAGAAMALAVRGHSTRTQRVMGTMSTRAAVYARVSTLDQEPENQLAELRRYVDARDWRAEEYVDHGVSGAKDRRPALDELLRDAKRRRFSVLVVWRLDRLGRNLRHLVTFLDELQALGISFVSLGEGIDCTTPAGRLQLHVLAALAEFERGRIQERVKAGLARARRQGKRLGRPRVERLPVALPKGLTVRQAAEQWGVSKSTAARWINDGTHPVASRTAPTPVGSPLARPRSSA
jgi:DNA invertase Pin-like site-specific DNA recombinase